MSAPNTTVDSSPTLPGYLSNTEDGISNRPDHLWQPQTERELAKFVYDLVTNGPGHP
jgi:hypothetical protein